MKYLLGTLSLALLAPGVWMLWTSAVFDTAYSGRQAFSAFLLFVIGLFAAFTLGVREERR